MSNNVQLADDRKIYDKRPQVLLLGNGFDRLYDNGKCWNDFIAYFNKSCDLGSNEIKEILAPYCYDIATIDMKKDEAYRLLVKNTEALNFDIRENVEAVHNTDVLRNFTTMKGIDAILTTNFNYSLEQSVNRNCYAKKKTKDCMLRNLRYMTEADDNLHYERKYMLQSYFEVADENTEKCVRFFHIHGAMCRPSSIILGHTQYVGLIHKIFSLSDSLEKNRQSCLSENKPLIISNWFELFMLGDVYIVGLGLDPCEIDLYWLLEKKYCMRERFGGEVWLYEPECRNLNKTRVKILDALHVKYETFQMKEAQCAYRDFYEKSCEEIKEKVANVESLNIKNSSGEWRKVQWCFEKSRKLTKYNSRALLFG